MHAIILAAGQGNRLAEFNPDARPKCLLEFGGKSLLARQLDSLFHFGIRQATLVVGYEADLIIEHVGTLSSRPEVAFVYNPAYTNGSVLSLLAAQDALNSNVTTLVLDADVLFHPQIMQTLIDSSKPNCYLLDRDLTVGDEPVKIALQEGKMVEFRKRLPANLQYDTLGESVGFFKFNGDRAAEIAHACAGYKTAGLLDAPHEEALRLAARLHPHEVCAQIRIVSAAEAHLRGEALPKGDNAAAGQRLDVNPPRPFGRGQGEDQSSPAGGKRRRAPDAEQDDQGEGHRGGQAGADRAARRQP